MYDFDVEKQILADKHAQKILERRNHAFRVLYETVIEVEGASDVDIFLILCRNLCRIAQASFAALATYDPQQNHLNLKSIVYRDKPQSEFIEIKTNVSAVAPRELVDRFIQNPLDENETQQFFMLNFFPDNLIPDNFKQMETSHCYNLACVHKDELIAVAQIVLTENKKIRMKDIVQIYLNLTGMIIQRANVAKALAESEEKYRNLVERANDGIVIVQDQKIKYANPKFYEITGFDFKQHSKIDFNDLVLLDELPKVLSFQQRNAPGNRKIQVVETKIVNQTGSEVDIELSSGSIQYENESAELIFIRDISDRKQAEIELNQYHQYLEEQVKERTAELLKSNTKLHLEIEERKLAELKQTQLLKELEEAYHELQDFAYVISHDLKAPLRGIGSLASWLVTDYGDKIGKEGIELLNLLTNRVKRMHRLIEGILKYTKVSRFRETKKVTDLEKLFSEVVEMIDVPENIEINLLKPLPQVRCVKSRIVQVFFNLLTNSIRYMDKEQGLIQIDYKKIEDNYWQFSVADNGPGIEQKYFVKIFQIFQTLTARDKYESTGVGLALARKVVEMHGGQIWVESKVGEGSTFYFTLPRN